MAHFGYEFFIKVHETEKYSKVKGCKMSTSLIIGKYLLIVVLLFFSCGGGFQSENADAEKFKDTFFKKKPEDSLLVQD